MRLELLLLAIALTSPLAADSPVTTPAPSEAATATPSPPAPSLTPRQAFQQAETRFSEGYVFSEKEIADLKALRNQLVETTDQDLAADVDLLLLGTQARAKALLDQGTIVQTLSKDSDDWYLRTRDEKNRELWKSVRDWGLGTFTACTAATLVLAAAGEQDDALMNNGYFSDWAFRQNFRNGLSWAMAGTATGMFLSLFPLLWGEARQ